MFNKVCLIFCGQMVLLNMAASQYIGDGCCCGATVAPINAGCAPITTSGGGFIVSSSSPINPSGLYVLSENTIEGNLGVNGQIPFLGAVALEADVPSQGNTAVQYNCGDCEIGITAERQGAAPAGPCCGAGFDGAGIVSPGFGYGAGLGYGAAGAGLGYGAGSSGLGLAGAGLCCGAEGAGIGYGGAGYGAGAGFANVLGNAAF